MRLLHLPRQKKNSRKTLDTLSPLLAPQEPETVGADSLQEDARVDTKPDVADGVREYRDQGQHLRIEERRGYKGVVELVREWEWVCVNCVRRVLYYWEGVSRKFNLLPITAVLEISCHSLARG